MHTHYSKQMHLVVKFILTIELHVIAASLVAKQLKVQRENDR